MRLKMIWLAVFVLAFALAAMGQVQMARPSPATQKVARPPVAAEETAGKPALPEGSRLEAELQQLKQLVQEQARELEGQRAALREQQERLNEMESQLRQQAAHMAALASRATASEERATHLSALEGQVAAMAGSQRQLGERITKLQTDLGDAQQSTESRLRQIGNFSFSGDVRLRYEPFFQGGGFTTRQRERIRARLNIVGKLTDEVSGGVSIASGSLEDVNTTNQTLTGFFTRKTVGFDRYFLNYRPNWWKPLSFTAGKFAYPWYRTPLTFDSDINPEGFAQTLSFDIKSAVLKNVTLVGFQLPFNEASGSYDSFIYGGQLQTRWKLSDRATLHLFAAALNFNRPDPIAVAVATDKLQPSLPNTNRLRTDSSGAVLGYASKYLLVDVVGVLDYNLHPRFPLQVQFNFVNNTRATTAERSGYWMEAQVGRLAEQKDFQFGYTFVRIERDAVLGAFNESDLRAATNVRNHRLNFGYQPYASVSLVYTLWVGRLANPQDSASLVPPDYRTACSASPFFGCQDPHLKRMQFDVIYKF